MEIKIDTKKDSAEEIRKMIQFLETFISNSEKMEAAPAVPSGAFNMFDSEPVLGSTSSEEKKEDETPDKLIFEY